MKLFERIATAIIHRATRRAPDFVIGGADRPYLRRWWITPWSAWYRHSETKAWWQEPLTRLPGIYLHEFLRSDDDRALHDHPWGNCSVLLRGEYTEHTIAAGGIHQRRVLRAGAFYIRPFGTYAHRIELHNGPCWTLFITGWRYRTWGFHCPERGWVPWRNFTAANDPGAIGKGCDQ